MYDSKEKNEEMSQAVYQLIINEHVTIKISKSGKNKFFKKRFED